MRITHHAISEFHYRFIHYHHHPLPILLCHHYDFVVPRILVSVLLCCLEAMSHNDHSNVASTLASTLCRRSHNDHSHSCGNHQATMRYLTFRNWALTLVALVISSHTYHILVKYHSCLGHTSILSWSCSYIICLVESIRSW